MFNAQKLIEIFDGPAKAARAIGVTPQAVTNWRARGSVPIKHAPVIIQAAKALGHQVALEEFFDAPGGD